jgi:MerR family transcriptional regulator, thiopeptide resistance regulator
MVRDEKWLSAAECAKRTGLTVRALRVYERKGLLCPSRSPSGWRRYGVRDLARLNVIVALKALGLSLARIRGLLTEKSPSLSQVLQMQCESLRSKVAESEYALSMAAVAARRLQERQKLSLRELCELVRSLDAARRSITQSSALFVRALMKELLTPEEQHAWDTWWATHPKDAAQNAAFLHERIQLYDEIHGLIDRGVVPSAAAAQQLMKRYNVLLEKYGVRERTVRTLDWNDSVTTRFMSMEAEARAREPRSDRLPRPFASQKLLDFIDAARRVSPWSAKLQQLLDDVERLINSGTQPGARAAQPLVQRLRVLCVSHGLGDAYVYARYTPFSARISCSKMSPGHERAWDFLVRALEVRRRSDRISQRHLITMLSGSPRGG